METLNDASGWPQGRDKGAVGELRWLIAYSGADVRTDTSGAPFSLLKERRRFPPPRLFCFKLGAFAIFVVVKYFLLSLKYI